MDELVAGEVEGLEPGEGGEEGGGDVVELVVGQAEEGQVGQHPIVASTPSKTEIIVPSQSSSSPTQDDTLIKYNGLVSQLNKY